MFAFIPNFDEIKILRTKMSKKNLIIERGIITS